MRTIVAAITLNAFAGILAPFRRVRSQRAPRRAAAAPAMDAATYAAMVAEAERIAAPYRRHIDQQLAALQVAPESDFPEVEALLARAGLLSI
jgi:hypothetical protein